MSKTDNKKGFDGYAFGSQSSRFNQNGLHPHLLTNGRMPYDSSITAQTAANIGPGSYDLVKYGPFSTENVSRRAEVGSDWERAIMSEKLAKMPHLLYQDTFKKKIEQKRRLGPGYYNVKHSHEVESFKPRSQRGMLDSLSSRFSDDILNSNPGPGAYGVPDEKLEEKRKNKPGKVQLFERSKEPRDLPRVGCEVPPGTYNHKSSIDDLINKRVSTRGPYDVFSENRSTIKWGHYAKGKSANLGPGQYDLNSFIDEMKGSANVKRGKFGKIAQYPNISGDRLSINNNGLRPRNPNWPGPGQYTPQELSKSAPVNQPAFLFSTNRSDKRSQAFFNNNFNSVGIGRYDVEKFDDYDKSRKLGLNSMFISKSTRMPSVTLEKVLRERLVPRNLDHQQKLNLHLTGNVNGNLVTTA